MLLGLTVSGADPSCSPFLVLAAHAKEGNHAAPSPPAVWGWRFLCSLTRSPAAPGALKQGILLWLPVHLGETYSRGMSILLELFNHR